MPWLAGSLLATVGLCRVNSADNNLYITFYDKPGKSDVGRIFRVPIRGISWLCPGVTILIKLRVIKVGRKTERGAEKKDMYKFYG